jgi:hypothetical protein
VSALAFAGPPPTAADLSRRWHDALSTADDIIAALPARQVGRAVLTTAGQLLTAGIAEIERLLADGDVLFHEGRIGGAWPQVKTRE